MEGAHRFGVEAEGPAAQLAVAGDRLEDALEGMDLADDRTLAEAVVEAVVATERAYRLAAERGDRVPTIDAKPVAVGDVEL